MRRIAAVALTAGTLMAGMAAVGAPAEAAATGSWKPYNSYSHVASYGTYKRADGNTYVTGYLLDDKKNGWTSCVRFKFTEGSKVYWSRFKIIGVTSSGTRYNFDGVAKVKISVKSTYGSHMWVQECGRNKKTGKYYYGKGKQIF
ncbi:hypothetical protein BKA00_004286 [Actinomadura coerulea]|uniref:Uncharacterized protein n=1 Tax=Actinomadura coerulea TaxID=46159 RepID=A0A7X0G229_9ACTN|nr:hypothetical protein [Actinomadura coerulea]MBB6397372.1 hypothetical protein [Actinomadura coerulea]GGQ02225.1 hypothetical protein GCM10010187_17380 [Actinomadura coerulea]